MHKEKFTELSNEAESATTCYECDIPQDLKLAHNEYMRVASQFEARLTNGEPIGMDLILKYDNAVNKQK